VIKSDNCGLTKITAAAVHTTKESDLRHGQFVKWLPDAFLEYIGNSPKAFVQKAASFTVIFNVIYVINTSNMPVQIVISAKKQEHFYKTTATVGQS
jgi:hypothetical protein